MKITSSDGKVTNFKTYGNKNNTSILLIHGLGAELSSWKNQFQEYSKNGYYVIAMDMYGHGESSNLNSLNLDEWDNQILNLLDYLDIKKVIICGVSMGGVIAQYFTVKHSERIKVLIVSDSFGELKTVKEKSVGFFQIIGFYILKILGRKRAAKLVSSAYKYEFATQAKVYMYNQMLNANISQLVKARKIINKIDVLNDLKQLDIPSLVIVGVCFGNSFIKINKKIADSINNSKFVKLKNSMDPSPLVNPTEFNYEVFKFLKKL